MKCQYCNGTGEHINDANRMTTCEFCGGTGICKLGSPCPHQESLTNEENIRSCSFEELAGEIYEWYSAGYTTGRVGLPLNSITEIVEWLKEKHE